MFYVRNIPAWKRVLRVLMGLAALMYAGSSIGISNMGVGVGIIGAMLAMTGLIGFCPVCAMVGRKV